MKGIFIKITRLFAPVILTFALLISLGTTAFADEEGVGNDLLGGEYTEIIEENAGDVAENPTENEESGANSGDVEKNVFDQIYLTLESNADKIFSILAFIGTIVVSVGYKSGLMPLLRDALSKLKSSIDCVKADSETMGALTERRMEDICHTLNAVSLSIEDMENHLQGYEDLMRERDSMRKILEGQIDMLYAIFMSSGLPQYQKDEIGERIKEMREELKSYEIPVEN